MRDLLREGAIARIVLAEVRGSAPREAGASMLVSRSAVKGTIGGGQLEWDAISEARALLDDSSRSARLTRIVLGAELGQCCGGVVTVLIERYVAADLSWLRAGFEAVGRGRAVLVSAIEGGKIEHRVVCELGVDPAVDQLLLAPRLQAVPSLLQGHRADRVLFERLDDELPPVWLYGAGHVGQALARMLVDLPVRLTWLDTRADAFPENVPDGVRVVNVSDPVASVAEAPAGTCFLIMTHSHPLDYALCRAILRRADLGWLGLIGSMSKGARFRSRLARDGLAAELIGRLVCPIGIGGIECKWPAAIAVAVAAQLLRRIAAAQDDDGETASAPKHQAAAAKGRAGARKNEAIAAANQAAAAAGEAVQSEHPSACAVENCDTCGSAGRQKQQRETEVTLP
jgi:xanthine dehydrogenase accessory factor